MGFFKSIKKAIKNPTHSTLGKAVMSVGDGTGGLVSHYSDKLRRRYGLTRSALVMSPVPNSAASSSMISPNRLTLSQMTGGR